MVAPRALRVEKAGDSITMRALNPERFTRRGFGTFLENVALGEISITQDAKDAILRSPYRGGIQALEIFGNGVLAWGAPDMEIMFPTGAISLHEGGGDWFQKVAIVEEKLP